MAQYPSGEHRGRAHPLTRPYAPGTYAEYLKLARVKETPGVPKAGQMVRLLIEGQEAVVRTAREVLPVAEKADDQPTLDLLTQRMQVHEKNAVDAPLAVEEVINPRNSGRTGPRRLRSQSRRAASSAGRARNRA